MPLILHAGYLVGIVRVSEVLYYYERGTTIFFFFFSVIDCSAPLVFARRSRVLQKGGALCNY